MSKKIIYKKRTSAGMHRYRPMGRGREKVSMKWGQWETVEKFNSLADAVRSCVDVRPYKNLIGSTEHCLFWGGKKLFHFESDKWQWLRVWLRSSNETKRTQAEEWLRDTDKAMSEGKEKENK